MKNIDLNKFLNKMAEGRAIVPSGACCRMFGPYNLCIHDDVTEQKCSQLGGTSFYPGQTCEESPCKPPPDLDVLRGSCCLYRPEGAACIGMNWTREQCEKHGDAFYPGQDCKPCNDH